MRKPATLRWTLGMASVEFDLDPKTLRKRIRAAGITAGDDGRYSTAQIVRAVFGDLRHEQIRWTRENADAKALENECTRKERIPIQIVNQVDNEVHLAMAATIKSYKNKVLTTELINELFAQIRSIPDKLGWPGVEKTGLG